VAVVYTAFATATLGFVIFAIANPAALVSEDYYGEASRHDRRMQATANGRAAGAALVMERDAAGRPIATLAMPTMTGSQPTGTVRWYRPSDISADRTLALALDAEGRQQMPVADLAAGHWRVKVSWEAEGRPFYFEAAVMVRP